MQESQESSQMNFANSSPELDLLTRLAKEIPGYLGARLSGGGFGGISVHLVRHCDASEYRRRLVLDYEKASGIKAESMCCQASSGAECRPTTI